MKKKHLKNYIYAIVGLSLWITIGFVVAILLNLCKKPDSTTWSYMGQLGDFFGGIVGTLVAVVGFVLIYLSFKSQTKSQEKQEQQFIKSQIESRFFELVRLHKENLNDIIYSPKDGGELVGRKAVDFIYGQIKECYKEIEPFFDSKMPEDIYNPVYLNKIKCYMLVRPNLCLLNLARLDIVYSIVFHGMSHDDHQTLNRLMINYYDEKFLQLIFRFMRLKPSSEDLMYKWDIVNNTELSDTDFEETFELLDKYNSEEYTATLEEITAPKEPYFRCLRELNNIEKLNRYYGGHQYKLGHYFRHLFQTVKYIDEKDILNYEEKYDYIKTLRAQLSTIEQYLFFFNSVSFMGRTWEFEKIVDGKDNDKNSVDKWLVSKYNLIKNIPDLYPFEDVLLINNYYPEIDFEFEEPSKTREKVSKRYWEK